MVKPEVLRYQYKTIKKPEFMTSHIFTISYLNLKDGSGIMSISKHIWVSISTKMNQTDIEGQLKRKNRIVLISDQGTTDSTGYHGLTRVPGR